MGTEAVRKENLASQVAAKVRREIYSGLLKEGDRLPPERDIAEKYGISRVSVRQALQELEREGWVEIVQGRGITVRDFRDSVGVEALPPLLAMSTGVVMSPGAYLALFEFAHWLYRSISVSAAMAEKRCDLKKLNRITAEYVPGISIEKYCEIEEDFYREMLAAGGELVLVMFYNTYARARDMLVESGVMKTPPLSRDLHFAFNEELAAGVCSGDLKRIDAAFAKYSPMVKAEFGRFMIESGLNVGGA